MSVDLLPLLLIVFPLAMAGGCLVLRETPRAAVAAGLIALAVEWGLAFSAPAAAPARLLDTGVEYHMLGRTVLLAVCAGAFVAILAAAAGEHGAHFVATLLLLVAAAAAIACTREPMLAGGMLLLSSLASGVQLADRPAGSIRLIKPSTLGLALRSSTLTALGGLVLLLGLAFSLPGAGNTGNGAALQIGFAMVLFGFAVRCGLIPFHVWLADIIEDAPPANGALHAALLAVVALLVLLITLDAQPQLLVDNPGGRRLLLGLGAVAALGGGLLGSTGDTRRSLAYLASANLGLLMIGIGSRSATGLQGAVLGAVWHVLGVGLAALGLALVSAAAAGRQTGNQAGRRAGLLVLSSGLAIVVGIPPFAGAVPKLLLLAAARQTHWLLAAVAVAGIGLMALSAGRLLSAALQIQPPEQIDAEEEPQAPGAHASASPSRTLLGLAMCVSLAAALAGFWLWPLTAQVDELVRGFGFVGLR